jgi:hypothetical protein
MKLQCAWVVVAGLGLAGCGGGGGGGSSDSDRGGEFSTGVTAADLVGTWVQTNINRADPLTTGELEWVKTRRQTIVIELVGGSLRMTDCIANTSLSGTLSNDSITFAAQPGLSLQVQDASTLTTRVTGSNSETDVELVKVSDATRYVLATVDASVDVGGTVVDRSEWSQVCVETVVDKYLSNSIQVKASGSENGVSGTVLLNFSTYDYFEAGQYNYPTIGNNVTGSFSLNSLVLNTSGNLSDPVGSMILAQDASTVMYFDLVLDSTSSVAPTLGIEGTIELNSEWLARPDGE